MDLVILLLVALVAWFLTHSVLMVVVALVAAGILMYVIPQGGWRR